MGRESQTESESLKIFNEVMRSLAAGYGYAIAFSYDSETGDSIMAIEATAEKPEQEVDGGA